MSLKLSRYKIIHLCECSRTQAQTLFICNSSKSRKAALKTVGSEFSWVTVLHLLWSRQKDFTHTKKEKQILKGFPKANHIFLENTEMQIQIWPPRLVSTWVCFLKVRTVLCWRIKMIEHTLIWNLLVWTIGLLSWRLTALTPTHEHVSTAVQIRLTHSSSAAQHGSSGKAPTYALRPKHVHVLQTSFTVLYFP